MKTFQQLNQLVDRAQINLNKFDTRLSQETLKRIKSQITFKSNKK